MKCRFEHRGDCCNIGSLWYLCKCEQPCDTIVPITNADRIRDMSDEELAEFIFEAPAVPCDMKISAMMKENNCNDCTSCIIEWLKQPAEE